MLKLQPCILTAHGIYIYARTQTIFIHTRVYIIYAFQQHGFNVLDETVTQLMISKCAHVVAKGMFACETPEEVTRYSRTRTQSKVKHCESILRRAAFEEAIREECPSPPPSPPPSPLSCPSLAKACAHVMYTSRLQACVYVECYIQPACTYFFSKYKSMHPCEEQNTRDDFHPRIDTCSYENTAGLCFETCLHARNSQVQDAMFTE
jgi:hypothetical protein